MAEGRKGGKKKIEESERKRRSRVKESKRE